MPCRAPLMQQRQPQELQGPRPAQLVVTNKAISKKRRPPVIIYVESPKVVHAHPSEFRAVVQRLTSAAPSSSSSGGVSMLPHHHHQLFPYFQLYAGLANNEEEASCGKAASQFTSCSSTIPVRPAGALTSYLAPPGPGDAAGASSSLISFFSNDQLIISPSTTTFLFDQNMAPAASSSASFQQQGQATNNLLVVSTAPPSLGGANRCFIDQL